MSRTQITFNGNNLQGDDIIIGEIQHEDIANKTLNIQKFSSMGGGKLNDIGFNSKRIKMQGMIRGTSKSDLENSIDDLKRLLNYREKDLDIAYDGGTRRYIATLSSIGFNRKSYTITNIEFEIEFIITDPAFGTALDSATIESLGNTDSSVSTTTMDNAGNANFVGTIKPFPKIKLTINACLGIKRLYFENTNDEGFFSRTKINMPSARKFQNGDIIIIDIENGDITLNGEAVEYQDGFPKFSLTDNDWNLKVVGQSYNIDVQIIYYSLWL